MAGATEADDNLATLLAVGVLAYACETTLHEAVGHGGMCLATGGMITLIAPLRMQCTLTAQAMVAAGPGANLIGAMAFWFALRLTSAKFDALRHFLWLSLAFNALVAAGYLFVGGATGFGDWAALLGRVTPAVLWRGGAVVTGVALYYVFLRLIAGEYLRLAGKDGATPHRLFRRAVIPASGAAVVACTAEIVGQGAQPLYLALALGATLGVGFSLTSIDLLPGDAPRVSVRAGRTGFSAGWVIAGSIVALVYVFVIGRGIG